MEVFEQCRDLDYDYHYDCGKTLEELGTLKETKTIIAIIYRDYWAPPEEREAILKQEELDRKTHRLERYNQILNDDEE